MRLFGRREPKPGSIVPVNNGITIQEIEVEKVVLTTERKLIGDVIGRLREKANECCGDGSGFNIYASIRQRTYTEIADELYTIAARPWFEELKP